MQMQRDTWNPNQYGRFANERSQPFYDLMSLLQPADHPRVVDLGCGTGELTRDLHQHMAGSSTLGVDASDAMLARTGAVAGDGLSFEKGNISDWHAPGPVDVLFSNAALQWVPDHEHLLPQLISQLAPSGQLAVQVPANDDHPAYVLVRQLVAREPYRTQLQGYVRQSFILTPERYAALLFEQGARQQHVRMQVYPHVLPNAEGVIEWMKGSVLTDYQRHFTAEQFETFVADFRQRVVSLIGPAEPCFYPFKRILFWARW
jgi:trans-aconitate 2-methyltransferase